MYPLLKPNQELLADEKYSDSREIILGEFGITLTFALLARTLRRGSWRQVVVAGIGGGFSIFVCYALAFWITDRLVK